MKIAHTSDLHGHLTVTVPDDSDVVVITGDFFPNKTRGFRPVEVEYQELWYYQHEADIKAWLKGKPVLWMPGNHDYVSLSALLTSSGLQALTVPEDGLEYMGLKWAGFREIPYIQGEWNGECLDFRSVVNRVMEADPDILVTHAPTSGILAGGYGGYGVSELNTALQFRYHKIKAHFFGHAHSEGGRQSKLMDILFSNAATTLNVVEI
jgi:Icc-related predicted phosphoesterase